MSESEKIFLRAVMEYKEEQKIKELSTLLGINT